MDRLRHSALMDAVLSSQIPLVTEQLGHIIELMVEMLDNHMSGVSCQCDGIEVIHETAGIHHCSLVLVAAAQGKCRIWDRTDVAFNESTAGACTPIIEDS